MQTVLEIIMLLGKEDQTTDALCAKFKISTATLKREISEARHLGADIKTVKKDKKSVYKIKNWKECKERTERWYELNKTKNLTLND